MACVKRVTGWYSRSYKLWPYSLAFATCYVKGALADGFTQTQVEKERLQQQQERELLSKNNGRGSINGITSDRINSGVTSICGLNYNSINFDVGRNVRFAAYSGVYCGSFQHFVYNVFYSRYLPGSSISRTLCRSLFDNFIHAPLIAMPCFFIVKSLFNNGSIRDGLKECWNEKLNVLKSYWKIWIPSTFCIMYFLPPEFRIFAIGLTSLVWLVVLSYMSPMVQDKDNKAQGSQQEEQEQTKEK